VKLKPGWSVGGRSASNRDLIEAVVQATRHRAAIAKRLRESEQMDRDARAVGAAIRRQTRALERKTWVRCRFSPVPGKRKGSLRSRRFETMVGLTVSRPSYVAGDGLSSFHFKVTSRGIGNGRRAKDRPYVRGEAVRTVRYILREAAREIAGGGIVSNISLDPDQIAGLFAALEELEVVAGDANGNVYISIVISLPAELQDPEALLAEICRPLADEALPYAAVLHAPDPDGDQRNNHAHVIASQLPLAMIGPRLVPDLIGQPCVLRAQAAGPLELRHALEAYGTDRRILVCTDPYNTLRVSQTGIHEKPRLHN